MHKQQGNDQQSRTDRDRAHVRRASSVRGAPTKPLAAGLVVLSLIVLTATSALAAVSSSPAKTLTPLQRGLAFYRGKTITFITPGTAGGGFDTFARIASSNMATYLHATINVLDEGQAQGTPGQDALAAAAPNGLTIGVLNISNDVEQAITNIPGLNFNPARLEFIAAEGPLPMVIVTTPSSPYTSISAIKSSATPPKALVVVPGASNTSLRILFGLLNINAQYISGYASASAQVTGFVRGDGNLTISTLVNIGSFIVGGQARAIAVSGHVPPGINYRQYVDNLPTFAALFKQFPPKTSRQAEDDQLLLTLDDLGNPIVTQTKVPSAELLALRAAAAWAFRQPAYKTAALTAGLNPTYLSPTVIKANYVNMIKKGGPLVCYINGTPC